MNKYTTKKVTTDFTDGVTPSKTEFWIFRPDGTPVAVCDLEWEAKAMADGLNWYFGGGWREKAISELKNF